MLHSLLCWHSASFGCSTLWVSADDDMLIHIKREPPLAHNACQAKGKSIPNPHVPNTTYWSWNWTSLHPQIVRTKSHRICA
eukprot:4144223-Amphidinium_carterae.1